MSRSTYRAPQPLLETRHSFHPRPSISSRLRACSPSTSYQTAGCSRVVTTPRLRLHSPFNAAYTRSARECNLFPSIAGILRSISHLRRTTSSEANGYRRSGKYTTWIGVPPSCFGGLPRFQTVTILGLPSPPRGPSASKTMRT